MIVHFLNITFTGTILRNPREIINTPNQSRMPHIYVVQAVMLVQVNTYIFIMWNVGIVPPAAVKPPA